jgi:hypothetical protein
MTQRWRNTEFMGDDLAEPGQSPNLSIASDGSRCVRTITLAEYSDFYQAALDFLGYPVLAQATNAGTPPKTVNFVSRSIPHSFKGISDLPLPPPDQIIPGLFVGGNPVFYQYPRVPLQGPYGWLFAKSMPGVLGVHPLGKGGRALIVAGGALDDAVAYYSTNKIRLEYRTLTHDVLPDYDPALVNAGGPLVSTPAAPIPDEGTMARYVTAYLRTAKKVINLRRGLMSFVPEAGIETKAVPIPEGFPFEEPTATLTVIHHEIPLDAIPYKAIINLDNAINLNPFWFGRFPAGTVRFDSWDYKPLFSPLGLRIVDLQYTLKVLFHVDLGGTARGWNWALRKVPGTGDVDYREVAAYAADQVTKRNSPYKAKDLADLFRPDQPP